MSLGSIFPISASRATGGAIICIKPRLKARKQPSKPDFIILTEMMKYRMHEMQITQKELSEILKISTPRLNQIMSGKKAPAYRQAQIIATELKIDAEIVL